MHFITVSPWEAKELRERRLELHLKALDWQDYISTTGLGLLLAEHHQWDFKTGWKNFLNNLRLIIQPVVAFNLITFWLKIFPIPELVVGNNELGRKSQFVVVLEASSATTNSECPNSTNQESTEVHGDC